MSISPKRKEAESALAPWIAASLSDENMCEEYKKAAEDWLRVILLDEMP